MHVTRSACAAELFVGGDALDQGWFVAQILHEAELGQLLASGVRTLRGQGGFIPVAFYVTPCPSLPPPQRLSSRPCSQALAVPRSVLERSAGQERIDVLDLERNPRHAC